LESSPEFVDIFLTAVSTAHDNPEFVSVESLVVVFENAFICLRSVSVTKEELEKIRLFLRGHFDIFLVF
jgi:hypothetical protein